MRIPGWRSEVCVYLHLLLLLAGREELLFVSGCNSHKEAVSRLFLAPPFLSLQIVKVGERTIIIILVIE